MEKQSILNITKDKKEILKIIAEQMLTIRPRSEVKLRPCYYKEGVTHKQYECGPADYNFYQWFPNAQKGDYVYFKTILHSSKNSIVALLIEGVFEA